MKKIIYLSFLVCVGVAQAQDVALDGRYQMLNAEIERLTKQRDEKYAALQECEKNTQGFKIAGITTLVATGVGVYANVKLSQKLNGDDFGGGGASARVVDNRSQEEKNDDSCSVLCEVGAAPAGCSC